MRKSRALLWVILSTVVALSGCTDFYKIQRSNDWKSQYEAAMAYYNEGTYNKASILFEIIRPLARGSREAEQIEFFYAYSNYYQKQYILSSHYFKTFYDNYRRSQYAEEALFMHAKSLYEQSPNANLDQTPTQEAIQALQLYLNRFPLSERRAAAVDLINELQQKLEAKAFNNAKQYYTLERYESAVIALDNFAKDYPDSQFREEATYLRFVAQYEFAEKSVNTKQLERYSEAVKLYLDFIDRYPASGYGRRAENQYDNCLDALEDLRQDNS
ncbi:MAG TPA: outer membrane protein assembly factor BamD [Cytophagales bacterium]|nr:outer membrane protein assembly factor BamD [Cytophagales bacterium]HAA19104.1 outer membrane protein assembly factor BamD [Cytophagales bacterium]HAP62737.1 outer membrane protein assembly factor BamD [Cytophagales bacterium]